MTCDVIRILSVHPHNHHHLSMQEFWTFANNVHEMAKFKKADCNIDNFLKKTKYLTFNEELSYDKKRTIFTESCLVQLSAFNVKFRLHHKAKERISLIDQLVENPCSILQRQVAHNEELTKFIIRKYNTEKK